MDGDLTQERHAEGLQAHFAEHSGSMRRMIAARLGSQDDADDLLQELWIRLADVHSGPVANPKAYLHKMALNLANDLVRERVRRRKRESSWSDHMIAEADTVAIDPSPSPERQLSDRMELAAMLATIRSLPDKAQLVFRRHRIDGLSHGEVARELGALTVGVVTKPFGFEGKKRRRHAEEGIAALAAAVDTLITIPNERLLSIAGQKTTMLDAFRKADDVLLNAVQGISDLITIPGLINVDFADVKTIMSNMGRALMGTGRAGGERRAIEAAQQAISSPLLEDVSITGATGILINITGGPDLTLFEVNEASTLIQEAAHEDANIIFGSVIDPSIGDELRITVIATGFDAHYADVEPTIYDRRPTTTQHQVPISFVSKQEVALPPPRVEVAASGAARRDRVATPVTTTMPTTQQRPARSALGTRLNFEDEDFDTPTYQRRGQPAAARE